MKATGDDLELIGPMKSLLDTRKGVLGCSASETYATAAIGLPLVPCSEDAYKTPTYLLL